MLRDAKTHAKTRGLANQSTAGIAKLRSFRAIHSEYYLGGSSGSRSDQRHRRELEPALLLRPFRQPELTEKLHLVEVEPVAGDDPIFDGRDIAGAYSHGFAGRRNSFPRGAL